MALQYGMNITASDMKSLLEKNDKQQSGVRSWRQLFGNASLGFGAQSDALTADYSGAVAEAYKANFKQKNAIMNAGLNIGATKDMLAGNNADMLAAYQTYVQNYNKDISTLANNYGEEVAVIDEALTERAENFKKLYDSAYKYLSEEVYGAYTIVEGNAENGATAVYTDEGKDSKFDHYENVNLDYLNENGLNWLVKSDASGAQSLMSWNEISEKIFNADGSLNRQGVQFFDQLMNARGDDWQVADEDSDTGVRQMRGFDEWLNDTDADLREWYISPDTFNYNFAGTNRGTANALMGRESTDDLYGAYEYANTSGMDEFNKFNFGESGEYFQKALAKLRAAEEWVNTANQLNMREAINAQSAANAGQTYFPTYHDPNAMYPEAEDAWNNYRAQVGSLYKDLKSFFDQKMGSEMSNAFYKENAALMKEYDALMDEIKGTKYANKDVTGKVHDWYNRLLKQMNAYIKKHGYTGKTSGF